MKVDTDTMILGVHIAKFLKLKGGLFSADAKGCEKQILEGIRIAQKLKAIWAEEDPDKPEPFFVSQKDVGSAGTAEQLHPDFKVTIGSRVIMMAKPDNGNDVFYAESKAKCETSGERFDRLEPGDSVPFNTLTNLNEVWIDAEDSSDGVSYHVELM